jgi:exonuclease VII small subunit
MNGAPDEWRDYADDPNLTDDEKAEAALQDAEQMIRNLEQFGPELAAQGIDVPAQLAEFRRLHKGLTEAQGKVEEADERRLQSIANTADADREMFQSCDQIVKALQKERPFDPEVQGFVEFMEEWKKQVPLDPED